jgi:flagellar motor switch/type III secretory pathway protein FliN
MQFTDYKLYTKKELAHIKGRLESIIGRWVASWLTVGQDQIAVEVGACEHHFSDDNECWSYPWNVATTSDSDWVATLSADKVANALISSLAETRLDAGDSGKTDLLLASSLAQVMSIDLAESVMEDRSRFAENATRVRHDIKMLPRKIWWRGSGAIYAGIAISDEKITVIISPGIARGYLTNLSLNPRESKPLAKITDALGHVKVKLEVAAGAADLSLGELNSLSIGDVIKLDAKLDRPVRVLLGKQKICSAFLGARKGSKAVLLMQSH